MNCNVWRLAASAVLVAFLGASSARCDGLPPGVIVEIEFDGRIGIRQDGVPVICLINIDSLDQIHSFPSLKSGTVDVAFSKGMEDQVIIRRNVDKVAGFCKRLGLRIRHVYVHTGSARNENIKISQSPAG